MSTFDLNSIDEVITPCCDVEVKTSDIGDKLKCPACGMNLKQRIFLPFLEYLMENGHVENLDFFDFDTNKEGLAYKKELIKVRRNYNKESGKIVFKQIFISDWLRKANEHLQALECQRQAILRKFRLSGNSLHCPVHQLSHQ